MKGKKEYIILAAIIIAAAAYLMLRQTDRTHYQMPQVAEISKNDITRIEIAGAGKTVRIDRRKDKWQIAPKDYPADAGKINRILDTIAGLKLTAMVSELKDDQRYDLGPKKRITVKAWAGKTVKREFMVGKAANTFRHTFVKIAGDPRIFHAEDNFRDRFDVTVDALRDKTVLAFKAGDIKTIAITRDGRTTTFKKKDSGDKAGASDKKAEDKPAVSQAGAPVWQRADGQTADPAKIHAFLAILADLACDTYPTGRTQSDLKDPVASIVLTGGKKTYRLTVYAKEKQGEEVRWPGQSSENAYIFLLPDWKAKDIVKDPADLMPKKPEKTPAAAAGKAAAATQ